MVLQCPGVIEVIGSAIGKPEPIPDHEIAAIQQVLSSRQAYEPYSHFVEGKEVRVMQAPLIGLQGVL